jgi:DnaJ-class molecular chaperone
MDVITMYGLKPLRVKAGTKPGDVIRMPGLGCRKALGFGVHGKGDQLVTVNVDFPSREDLRQKSLWQRLEIDWSEDDKEDKESEDFMRIFATVSTTTNTWR